MRVCERVKGNVQGQECHSGVLSVREYICSLKQRGITQLNKRCGALIFMHMVSSILE